MMVKMLSIVLKMDKKAEAVLVDCVNGLGVAFQIADDLLNLARSDNMGKGVIAEDLH
jgi:geranylgeranyl pyrophosphate synthase